MDNVEEFLIAFLLMQVISNKNVIFSFYIPLILILETDLLMNWFIHEIFISLQTYINYHCNRGGTSNVKIKGEVSGSVCF